MTQVFIHCLLSDWAVGGRHFPGHFFAVSAIMAILLHLQMTEFRSPLSSQAWEVTPAAQTWIPINVMLCLDALL